MSYHLFRRTELLPVDNLYGSADQQLLTLLTTEDRRFERKASGIEARALGDYFSILANSAPDGGLIAIGIDDDRTFSGCLREEPKHLNELERAGDVYCPDARHESKRIPIRNVKGEADFVLLFRIKYRKDKVVENIRGEAWVRHGESKKRLSDDEKRELRIAKREIDLEQGECALSYPEQFDAGLIHEFADSFRRAANVPNTDDREILDCGG